MKIKKYTKEISVYISMENTMEIWPGQSNGQWFFWEPYFGIDKSLHKEAMMIGAAIYAKAKYEGISERDCHVEAEKAAFTYQYNLCYK
jgi:hypothetical protein